MGRGVWIQGNQYTKWDWSPLQNKDVSSKIEFLSGEDERNMPSSLLNEDLLITWWLSERAASFTSYSSCISCDLYGEFSNRLFEDMLVVLYGAKLQFLHNVSSVDQNSCTKLLLNDLKLSSKIWFHLEK